MLTRFDWIRRCRSGPELLATLQYLDSQPELPSEDSEVGPPPSARTGPCLRCWIYPRAVGHYCVTCHAILDRAWQLRQIVLRATVIWGFVNRLPRPRPGSRSFAGSAPLGLYLHDERRFLLMLPHDELKPWLQDLLFYYGIELKGLLQIFPTTGGRASHMGDLIARIVHHEARFPHDKLRIRFFAKLDQVFRPRPYEKEGVLTFEVAEFLRTLELATVFRTLLRPDEQKTLYRLLHTADSAQAQLYWGRFLGLLRPEARDMLAAWGIRHWSEYQISLLYELVDYVAFVQSG